MKKINAQFLLDRRRLNAIAKTLTVNELEKVANNIQLLMEKAQEREADLERKAQEKLLTVKAIKELMAQSSISLDELNVFYDQESKKTKPKKQIKYQYKDTTWAGRGRIPKAIKEQIEMGASLDSFRV